MLFTDFLPKILLTTEFLARLNQRLMDSYSRRPSTLLNISSETAWPISQISYGPSIRWRNESYSTGPGHMTKMTTMPICGKNLKKSSFLEPKKADDFETWYAASGARVLGISANIKQTTAVVPEIIDIEYA